MDRIEGRVVSRAEAQQAIHDVPAPPSRTQEWNQAQAEKDEGEEELPFSDEDEDDMSQLLTIVLFNEKGKTYHKASLDIADGQYLTNEACNLDDTLGLTEYVMLPPDVPSSQLCKRCYGALAT